jgi:molecular chaperone GrpE (heat shock protein)
LLGRKGERAAGGEPDNEITPDAADPATAVPDDTDQGPAEAADALEDLHVEEGGTPGGDGEEDPALALTEELERANDRHLRLVAEFENFRKRTRREAMETSALAQAEFARRLLPTLDDLARVSSTPPESTTVEALDQGLDLILRNLRKELQEIGLDPIDALGSRFDPELHQAVLTAETAEKELDDIVSRVFVDGYTFQGRLVRPAQVEVLNYSPDGDEDA